MSKIEWTEKTWNPVVGCSVASPGCKNCYAMRMAGRLEAINKATEKLPQYVGTTKKVNGKNVWTGKIGIAPDRIWEKPLRRKKPTIYFVNSESDLFHPNVPEDAIDSAFAVMALSPQHTFQILTKHPERMRDYFNRDRVSTETLIEIKARKLARRTGINIPPVGKTLLGTIPWPHVWLGVSVESAGYKSRMDVLRETPASIRFVSFEPLIDDVGIVDLDNIDWAIVGGESGPNSRFLHPDWVRSLRAQSITAGTAFFFKQWGQWLPWEPDAQPPFFESQAGDYVDGHVAPWLDESGEELVYDPQCKIWDWAEGHGDVFYQRVGKKAAGRLLDGSEHNAMPAI